MIRIARSPAPDILALPASRGWQATQRLKTAFSQGQRTFTFDAEIYGHESVKSELLRMQHGKCCFCESKITHVQFGDVEHFRPKGGFVQSADDRLQQPGYYWLAYDWSNLLLSCSLCNQRHKKNHFPLLNPRSRARSHRGDVSREKPVFIDPATENPEQFIGFRAEQPYGLDPSGRGAQTIAALGLRRTDLEESRRTKLEEARRTAATIRVLRKLRSRKRLDSELTWLLAEHEAAIKGYHTPSTEYQAMLRANGILDFME